MVVRSFFHFSFSQEVRRRRRGGVAQLLFSILSRPSLSPKLNFLYPRSALFPRGTETVMSNEKDVEMTVVAKPKGIFFPSCLSRAFSMMKPTTLQPTSTLPRQTVRDT